MLRITILEGPDEVTMKLEGRVVGPWSGELNRSWQSLGPSLNDRKLCVDLCGVTYIDRRGREILAEIYRSTKGQFQTDTPLTEYFAQEARNGTFKNGNDTGYDKEKGAPK